MIAGYNDSHLQRPYGTPEKSASAILAVLKRFVVNMGVPRVFQTDNGSEYSNGLLQFTAPYTLQQNGPVESAISKAFKAGYAARQGVPQLFPDVRLEETRVCTDAAGTTSMGLGMLNQ